MPQHSPQPSTLPPPRFSSLSRRSSGSGERQSLAPSSCPRSPASSWPAGSGAPKP